MSHAQLEICPSCGKHGRIVLADGFIGLEFCCQQHALELVRCGLEEMRNISQEDAELLRQAVRASGLPSAWYMIDIPYHWQIESWNQFRINNGAFHPLGPHDFLQRPVRLTEIPVDFINVLKRYFAQ